MGKCGAPASCGCGAVGVEDRRARLAAWCAFMVRLCSCTRLIITISRASEPCMQRARPLRGVFITVKLSLQMDSPHASSGHAPEL